MKKIFLGTGIRIILILIGYFFIYPYDYVVRFEAHSFPGTINQTLKIWDKEVGVPDEPIAQEDLTHLTQTVQVGDSIHEFHWELEAITYTTTLVTAKIKDRNHSLANKLMAPLGRSKIESLSKKNVLNFADKLKTHIDEFRVTVVGESELPATFYAYVNVKTSQHNKAGGMMDNFSLLSEVLTSSGTALNGPPMIVVNSWNREKDSLDFNFCFPIVPSDNLPNYPGVEYKRIFPKRALKAIYNGNYITSDRAWYALLDYAERNNIPVEEIPVEIFYNNPNMGGNALTWKAEIFLPIKE